MSLGLVGLSIASAFLAEGRCLAQGAERSDRLRVRPQTMATGTQTVGAGEHPLDSLPDFLVYVPPQCVGTRRCPLFVFMGGLGNTSKFIADWLGPVADKYGMILLPVPQSAWDAPDWSATDAALTQVLRKFAIDPDKIAVIGRCASGGAGMTLGAANLDVFSRIASISGAIPIDGIDPQNKTAEFFIDAGFPEFSNDLDIAQQLRQAGHPVKVVTGFRDHEHQVEDYDALGRWLRESWATPNPAARPAPQIVADPLPPLTTEVLRQMTAFWDRFMQEPDSIWRVGRRAYLREVAVPIGELGAKEVPAIPMVDMTALAAKYPSVAAELRQVGLTGQQHDAYRMALFSALFGASRRTAAATSIIAQNAKFVNEHQDEIAALEATGIWKTP